MITTIFMYVHIVYCRNLQLTVRWLSRVTLRCKKKLHAWCTGPNRILKRSVSASITDKLDIHEILVLVQFSEGWVIFACCLFLIRAFVDFYLSITEAHSISTTLIQKWQMSAPWPPSWPDWDDTSEEKVQFDPAMLAICHYRIHRRWMLLSRGKWWVLL